MKLVAASHLQPFVFFSHGAKYEVGRNPELHDAFARIRADHIPRPEAIVMISAHYISRTNAVMVTTGNTVSLPPDWPVSSSVHASYPGHPELAQHIIDAWRVQGIDARGDDRRGLDHGAFIPYHLLQLDGSDGSQPVPIVQVSLVGHLDPVVHQRFARALMQGLNGSTFDVSNVLWMGSGGSVHNLGRMQPFGGFAASTPDAWALEFDDYLSRQVTGRSDTQPALVPSDTLDTNLVAAYAHPHFDTCHPTSDHFIPLVYIAALAGAAAPGSNVAVTQMYRGFQWRNLSMGAYKFEPQDSAIGSSSV